MKLSMLMAVVVSTLVGCAGSSDGGEAVAGDEAAFTQDSAFAAIIGKTFVSGHCGRSLTLERASGAPARSGKFTYSSSPCSDDDGPAVRDLKGTFTMSGALGGGSITDASLDLKATTGERWSYDVEESPAPESDDEMPKGQPILHGDKLHGEHLISSEWLD